MLSLRKYSQFLYPRQVKIIYKLILSCLLIGSFNLYAIENNGRGTKAIGMGNAFVAVSDNAWALNYNPAGLIQISNFEFSAFIVPEQFGMQELRTTAFAAVIPFSPVSLGLKLEKFGFELFSESEIGVGAAVKLDKSISIGININYNHINIYKYGTSNKIVIDAGILSQVTENITTGFSFHNITRSRIGKMNEKLPQVISVGTCWKAINTLKLSLEIEKDVRYPASIKMGLEKILFSTVALYGGIGNNPDKYSTGIAVKYSYFEFSYAGYSHLELGWTHQIELTFKLDDNK